MTATEEHSRGRPGTLAFPGDGRPLLSDLRRIWTAGDDDPLRRIAAYALLPAGKLLRPLLVLESAKSVGGSPDDLGELALAVEYLHVATLIHDDIIDEDDIRRGRPAVHAAFGTPDAIVTGDGLLLQAFAALTRVSPAGVTDTALRSAVAVLADAGIDLCRGQLREAELTGDLHCSTEQYLTMARLKTGVLFEASCRIGAILGGGPPAWVDALGTFGVHLGVAFQIRDDLLGFDDNAELVGKPNESDVANRRPTLPMLLAYQSAGADDRDLLERAFRGELSGVRAFPEVRRIVEETGARAAAEWHAADLIDRAKRALAPLPGNGAVLTAIADYARERGH
ncbi:polyprenyl synthetase family protein [Actinoplanes flavus]|uniref:Polyprenyl synthetase family protein n=1 Tax=Actinoplanes flavus TaxID=2820290 RepID=A0ABS3US11_9ACTN|nr:polyprenyl synthetase family protein [Actinoplanes flavus]MBO3741333.1 polyprenyl synthetase family protein [Actinoplanes flavus]